MILEEGVVAYLLSQAGVTDLIGTRLDPLVIPQERALPAVSYQRISSLPWTAHDGSTGWAKTRLQFTCQALGYLQVKTVARAIRQALDGFRGVMGDVPVHGTFVQNDVDGFNEGTGRETVRLDALFICKES